LPAGQVTARAGMVASNITMIASVDSNRRRNMIYSERDKRAKRMARMVMASHE
jgi:hypothetical protein